MSRRLVDIVALAIVPWLLACLVNLAERMLFLHGSDVFGAAARESFTFPAVLIPAIALVAATVIAALRQRNVDSVLRTRWLAGGWFAGWSTIGVALLGLVGGGGYGAVYLTGWAFLTGYVAFLWLAGAYIWRRAYLLDDIGKRGMTAATARLLLRES